MKPLTVDQEKHAEQIVKGTEKLRVKVTLYRKNDPEYAIFRVIAFNNFREAVIRKVRGKKRTKRLNDYVEYWRNDGPGGIGEYVAALFDSIENDF